MLADYSQHEDDKLLPHVTLQLEKDINLILYQSHCFLSYPSENHRVMTSSFCACNVDLRRKVARRDG